MLLRLLSEALCLVCFVWRSGGSEVGREGWNLPPQQPLHRIRISSFKGEGGRGCSRAEKEWERDAGRKTIMVCVCHSTVNPEQEKKPKDSSYLSPLSHLRFGSGIQHSVQRSPRNIGWNEEEEMTDCSYTSQVAVSCDTPDLSVRAKQVFSLSGHLTSCCLFLFLSFSSAPSLHRTPHFTSRQPSPGSALKLNIKCINYRAIIPRNLYGCRI